MTRKRFFSLLLVGMVLVTMLPLTAAWGTSCPVSAVVYPEGSGTVEGVSGQWGDGDHSIKATPATGYAFVRWEVVTGSISISNPTNAETAAIVTDTVDEVVFTVTTSSDPAAGGSVTGGGQYEAGKTVTLTATANAGYRFKAWQVTSGGVTVGSDGTFTMPQNDVAVTARWTPELTVKWLDGDDSVLETKTYWADEAEPTTDKKATKASDELYQYVFTGFDNGTVEGNVKTYRPLFTQKPIYTVTAESRYRLKSGKQFVLTVKRTVDEDTIVDDLVEVKAGSKVLTRDTDYTVTAGSAVVTISPKAMNRLSAGRKTIAITFQDGVTVTAKVKILDALDDQSGTGDNSYEFLWLSLTVVGMLGLGALYLRRRRLLGR